MASSILTLPRHRDRQHSPPVRGLFDEGLRLEAPSSLQRLGYLIANPWKNYLLPVRRLRSRLARSASPLITESLARPGGWRSMEILYRNDDPCDWFDRQALRDNPLSMACRNRRKVVTRKLSELIAIAARDRLVTILGIGAGPGRHVQEAIVASQVAPGRITAYLIDRDDEAFEYGRQLALSLGVARCLKFVRGDARRIQDVLPHVVADIVKLVGLVEYLSDVELVELLRALRDVMNPHARLVTHGLNDPYGGRRFLERVFQLRHRRRTASQMGALLEAAGFRVVDCLVEPVGIYPIITAERSE